MLVDRYSNHLVVYDVAAGRVVAEEDRDQTFVYAMPDRRSDVVTVGSSNGGPFVVARLRPEGLRTLVTVRGKGVFPLAGDGTRSYFVVNTYASDNTVESTQIAVLDGSALRTVAAPDATVAGGVLVGERLWFTTDDGAGQFRLHSLATSGGGGIRDEKRMLSTGSLFAVAGKVVVDGAFGGAAKTVDCEVYCSVDDAAQRLYVIRTDREDLALEVYDLGSDRHAVLVTGDILDLAATDGGLRVFLRSGVRDVPEGSLP